MHNKKNQHVKVSLASVLAGVLSIRPLLLFKTGLKHHLLASINDENLGTKLNKILASFGSRTGKIEDIIMKSSCNLSVED